MPFPAQLQPWWSAAGRLGVSSALLGRLTSSCVAAAVTSSCRRASVSRVRVAAQRCCPEASNRRGGEGEIQTRAHHRGRWPCPLPKLSCAEKKRRRFLSFWFCCCCCYSASLLFSMKCCCFSSGAPWAFGRPTPPSAARPSLQEIQGPQGCLTPIIVKTPPDVSRCLKT